MHREGDCGIGKLGPAIFYRRAQLAIDRDAAGQWKTTQSFGRNDLLVLAKVVDRAHSCIFELQRAEDESGQAA